MHTVIISATANSGVTIVAWHSPIQTVIRGTKLFKPMIDFDIYIRIAEIEVV